MEKVTYGSLKEVFGSVYGPWYGDNYNEWGEDVVEDGFRQYVIYDIYDPEIKSQLKDLGLEFVEKDGGGEGGTEDCYTIIKYKGEFYKLTYWYRSHHGYDGFEDSDFVKVTPKKIEVTVYE